MVDSTSETLFKNVTGSIDLGKKFRIARIKGKVLLDSPSDSIILDIQDILFVEVLGDTIEIHFRKDIYLNMNFSINDYRQFIQSKDFIQVDEFLLININHIKKYQVTGIPYVELNNGLKKRTNPLYHQIILRRIIKLEQIK